MLSKAARSSVKKRPKILYLRVQRDSHFRILGQLKSQGAKSSRGCHPDSRLLPKLPQGKTELAHSSLPCCLRSTRTVSSFLNKEPRRYLEHRSASPKHEGHVQFYNNFRMATRTTDASCSKIRGRPHPRGWLHPVGSKLVRRRRPRLHGAVLLASCWWCVWGVDAYTLRVRVQPGRAQGGVAFLEQPQVEILEGNGGDMDVFFEVGIYGLL